MKTLLLHTRQTNRVETRERASSLPLFYMACVAICRPPEKVQEVGTGAAGPLRRNTVKGTGVTDKKPGVGWSGCQSPPTPVQETKQQGGRCPIKRDETPPCDSCFFSLPQLLFVTSIHGAVLPSRTVSTHIISWPEKVSTQYTLLAFRDAKAGVSFREQGTRRKHTTHSTPKPHRSLKTHGTRQGGKNTRLVQHTLLHHTP